VELPAIPPDLYAAASVVTLAEGAFRAAATRVARDNSAESLSLRPEEAVPSTAAAAATDEPDDAGEAGGGKASGEDTVELSPEAQAIVREMQAQDAAVRAHEMAHIAAAAGIRVSGPVYTYQRGPDGRSYAVAGEVQIDVSPGNTPEETIERARAIQAAALAPANPSSADLAAAAAARRMEMAARAELAAQDREASAGQAGGPASAEARGGTREAAALYDAIGGSGGGRIDVFA